MIDLSVCESPLERKLGEAFIEVIGNCFTGVANAPSVGSAVHLSGWQCVFSLQPDVGWCRPDFMFVSLARGNVADFLGVEPDSFDGVEDNVVVVEVDGHDFHERTKEQARRDRARDRKMIDHGWLPLRFTGQEVHEDAIACAEQAAQIFFERQGKVMSAAFALWIEKAAADKKALGQ